MKSEYYWQQGIKFINKKEYTKAIESYNKAINLGDSHPFLYSNIAGAYDEIGDYKNALDWYNNSVDKLLELQNPHSGNPYFWTANFYSKNSIVTNKTIKLIQKALLFYSKDPNTLLLYSNILLKSKKKNKNYFDEAISKLSWIESYFPNHKESKSLRNKYKDEIKLNMPSLKLEKEKKVLEILKEKDELVQSINYVVSKRSQVTTGMSISEWTIDKLLEIPLSIDDDFMLRAYRLHINYNKEYGLEKIKKLIFSSEKKLERRIEIMKKLDVNIFRTISFVIHEELDYTIENGIWKTSKKKHKSLKKKITKIIFPNNESNMIEFYKSKEMDYFEYLWVEILLEYNYNKYINIIKNKLLKLKTDNDNNYYEIKIIELINDKNFTKKYYSKKASNECPSEYRKDLINFINGKNINLKLSSIDNKERAKYINIFCKSIDHLDNKFNDETIKRIVAFAEILDFKLLFDRIFEYRSDKMIINMIKKYNFSISTVLLWATQLKESNKNDYKDSYSFSEKLIKYLIKENSLILS